MRTGNVVFRLAVILLNISLKNSVGSAPQLCSTIVTIANISLPSGRPVVLSYPFVASYAVGCLFAPRRQIDAYVVCICKDCDQSRPI